MEEIEAIMEACEQMRAELRELQARFPENPELKDLISRHARVKAWVESCKGNESSGQG